MKAVVLEDYAIQQGDLDWSGVKALVPDITRYGRTAQEGGAAHRGCGDRVPE